jgi:2-C-methyl-D-erythritol 4-phosphate cytidylyltransferase/2-C-methyl-D-erythritol 2,4-cyclodiphosphate synthase
VAGIVVAAGRSARLGGALPKQFASLGEATVLERAVRALALDPRVEELCVVLPEQDVESAQGRAAATLPRVTAVVPGGSTRAESVRRGLQAVSAEHVLVHDAARPFCPARVVQDVVDATLQDGAAVPVLPVHDTVKEDDGAGFVLRTLARSTLRLAQTPQGARTVWLQEALERALREGVEPTDEATALERAGRRVRMVAGDPGNLKITDAADLEEARRRAVAAPEWRVGTGFDVHRFAPGRRLVLGGVWFPGEEGLAGHSDADVVLHAAMDALLGAAGLPDIGVHFPPDDPAWEGADSRTLAARVAELVRASGFTPVNLDLTVLCERPRLRPHIPAMCQATAAAFGVEPARVGIKATTLEGLGALGRGEGIACQASALVRGLR